jgi:hypothetical protein
MGTTGAGTVYIRPNGFGSSTDQTTFSTSQVTFGTLIQVNEGAGYTSTLYDEILAFSRTTANYIRASSTGGTLVFLTDGRTTSTAEALLYISTTDVTLRYGSGTPATKLVTTNSGVTITGAMDVNATSNTMSDFSSSVASGYTRMVLHATVSGVDTQLSFQEASSTKWSVGNNADNDAFVIRRGFGAFGTNDHFWILTTGNAYFSHGVYAAGELESFDTSDIHLKKNIEDVKLERARLLLNARVIEYDHIKKEKREIGLIYQEIKEMFSEVTKKNPDGEGMIQYGKLVAPIVLLLQDIDERLSIVESTIRYHGTRSK